MWRGDGLYELYRLYGRAKLTHRHGHADRKGSNKDDNKADQGGEELNESARPGVATSLRGRTGTASATTQERIAMKSDVPLEHGSVRVSQESLSLSQESMSLEELNEKTGRTGRDKSKGESVGRTRLTTTSNSALLSSPGGGASYAGCGQRCISSRSGRKRSDDVEIEMMFCIELHGPRILTWRSNQVSDGHCTHLVSASAGPRLSFGRVKGER
jgi:hypothetical protein